MHIRRYLVVAATFAAFTLIPAAHGFIVGVSENDVGHDPQAQQEARDMGLSGVRVFVFWAGETEPSAAHVALVRGAQATGARVFANITGDFRSGVVANTVEACAAAELERLAERPAHQADESSSLRSAGRLRTLEAMIVTAAEPTSAQRRGGITEGTSVAS